ncbi:MAG: hypothetical protein EOP12_01330 [Pseudomonas sp.]|nr:MAG: hypothetical protein EOP12_01330 [Pseudomonas sp.]
MNNSAVYISKFFVTCYVIISASSVFAQTVGDFRCKVHLVTSASSLTAAEQRLLDSTYVGKEFTVERRTGHMAGALKILSPVDPQIIDSGSSENSFKMIASMRRDQGIGAGTAIYSLVINTFDSNFNKPFLFTYNTTAYRGTCLAF